MLDKCWATVEDGGPTLTQHGQKFYVYGQVEASSSLYYTCKRNKYTTHSLRISLGMVDF